MFCRKIFQVSETENENFVRLKTVFAYVSEDYASFGTTNPIWPLMEGGVGACTSFSGKWQPLIPNQSGEQSAQQKLQSGRLEANK